MLWYSAGNLRVPIGQGGSEMPKYLIEASYTNQGAAGLAREGGSSRRAVVEAMLSELGGKLESFYFAFGDVDAYVIADLPDNVAASAVALAVNKSGAAKITTVPLLTVEEV